MDYFITFSILFGSSYTNVTLNVLLEIHGHFSSKPVSSSKHKYYHANVHNANLLN